MQDCLGFSGDGDELDVIVDVERTFGISVSVREAEELRNVGDLHDLIESRFGAERTKACHSQIAFYALRRALVAMGAERHIAPVTPISQLRALESGSVVRLWDALGRRSGLCLPALETPFSKLPHWVTKLSSVFLAVVAVATFIVADRVFGTSGVYMWLGAFFGAFVLCAFGMYVTGLVFRDVPARLVTLGDLAREAAGYNFSELSRVRTEGSRSDRWYALEAILRPLSGFKRSINRSTTFISS
ncbi:MAG: acyl carrier protein [Pseudolabrys sp.]|nr:acyl carrier protein [Pseudolabrys sp.]